ncbi:8036_t:CDS:2 [Gigaspora margarita]|uniref:8036_t:CDS:1 n=1 Tax=Gigaspora margarita TaxID=4874 RepID=A0ABN7UAA4_GIGMA|nr:8036_t:CDS:2 [Gigaspora margarita]
MTSAESLHLSVPLEVVECSCSVFGTHVWCNGHQHAITTKDNFVYLSCENEHIIKIQIDKGIDRIWVQLQTNVNLAMLHIRAKAQVIVRNKDHPTPDSGQMSILCATRDLNALKKFISHIKNPENSVQIKPMDVEQFKSLIKKHFDSDGNVLPSGKIKNPLPLMRTQLLGRNTSPPTSSHGKEICRNTSVSSSANSTNAASHSTLPNANSNHLSNSTDEEVIVVSSVRKRNSLNRKRSGPSSDLANETEMDHKPNPDFLAKFSGIRLRKKYKPSTDIVTYSNHRSNNSAKSPRTLDNDFIISPNKKRTSLISTQTRQRADSSLDQVEETDVRFRRRFRVSTNSGNNSKETSSTLTKENASTSPKYVDPDVVILGSLDRRSKIQSLGRRDPNSKLFDYHCVGYSSLLITGSDYNRLIDMDELNDNLILREHDEANARKYYLFDSYFYKKLSDLRDAKTEPNEIYNQMSRWIKKKKIDLFDFQYIFVPICENGHWYLVLIINPAALGDNRIAECYIAIFDSIAESFKHSLTVRTITNFLFDYTRDTRKVTIERTSIPYSLVNSPKQKNNVDCGIYVLHFTETFMWNSEVLKRQIIKAKTNENSWKPYDLPDKRNSILDIIDNLANQYLLHI